MKTPVNNWGIERKIPFTLVFILVGQLIAALWYASKLDSRVENLEKTADANTEMIQRMTKVEVQIQGLRESQSRMEGMLNKMLEKR